MPGTCAVPYCRSNYRHGPKMKVYHFPKDPVLQKKWILAMRRADFTPTIHSRVCELHFKDTDYITTASGVHDKTGELIVVQLVYRRLRPDAIPSIFSCFPAYSLENTSSSKSPDEKEETTEQDFTPQNEEDKDCDTSSETGSHEDTERAVDIKQVLVEPTDEPPPMVIENILNADELPPFSSNSPVSSDLASCNDLPSTNNSPASNSLSPTSSLSSSIGLPSTSHLPSSTDLPSTNNLSSSNDLLSTNNLPASSCLPSSNDLPSTSNLPASSNLSSSNDLSSTSNLPASSSLPSSNDLLSTSSLPSSNDFPSTSNFLASSSLPSPNNLLASSSLSTTSSSPLLYSLLSPSSLQCSSNLPSSISLTSFENSPHFISSTAIAENALPVVDTDSPNVDKASVTNKPERKRKIKTVNLDESNSPSATQAKLTRFSKPPISSNTSSDTQIPSGSKELVGHSGSKESAGPSGSKKSAGPSGSTGSAGPAISPTEDTRTATRVIFQSLLSGSESNSLPCSRTRERPDDLFDVFSDFIADKLRKMNWENCAFSLRSILDIVFKAGQAQQSSDDEEETCDNSYSDSDQE